MPERSLSRVLAAWNGHIIANNRLAASALSEACDDSTASGLVVLSIADYNPGAGGYFCPIER